ncbi:MAG: tRNA-intron lyase [Candidatus Micrarchaeia archaeon]|jgi:tRNA-intron endonuclease
MGVNFTFDGEKARVTDLVSVQALDRSFYGIERKEKGKFELELTSEEALYLLDVRNAECKSPSGKSLSFNDIAKKCDRSRKFLARYFCYKDWRDRGLVAREFSEAKKNYGRNPVKKYPAGEFKPFEIGAKGLFFFDDLMTVIDDDDVGAKLYDGGWFGQLGTYKARKHGRFLKLDAYETLFLMRHCGLQLNVGEKRLIEEATKRRSDFLALYEAYEDWRLAGCVLKTGFKFGTHFRLYLPGASPALSNDDWMHSKHVIHVFPRESKMLISEWSRAIRVAHGVKKTFILAIPGTRREVPSEIDFILYHRGKDGIENPKNAGPRFAMLALSEEEEIGGQELAKAIETSKKFGLDLMLAICDRETSVTHYLVKRIALPSSKFEYYEIEWSQP